MRRSLIGWPISGDVGLVAGELGGSLARIDLCCSHVWLLWLDTILVKTIPERENRSSHGHVELMKLRPVSERWQMSPPGAHSTFFLGEVLTVIAVDEAESCCGSPLPVWLASASPGQQGPPAQEVAEGHRRNGRRKGRRDRPAWPSGTRQHVREQMTASQRHFNCRLAEHRMPDWRS